MTCSRALIWICVCLCVLSASVFPFFAQFTQWICECVCVCNFFSIIVFLSPITTIHTICTSRKWFEPFHFHPFWLWFSLYRSLTLSLTLTSHAKKFPTPVIKMGFISCLRSWSGTCLESELNEEKNSLATESNLTTFVSVMEIYMVSLEMRVFMRVHI